MSNSAPVDANVHLLLCINHFQRILQVDAADRDDQKSTFRTAICQVYRDASQFLTKVLEGSSWLSLAVSTVGTAPASRVPDHGEGAPLSSSSHDSSAAVEADEAALLSSSSAQQQQTSQLLEDLLLCTSYACSAAAANVLSSQRAKGRQRVGTSDFLTRNKEIIYPKDVLIALAPFWAVLAACADLLAAPSPLTVAASTDLPRRLQNVSTLLSKEIISTALMNMNEDILRHMTYSQTLHVEHSSNYALYSRLKKAVKTHLKTPLFLATTLSLAAHFDGMVLAAAGAGAGPGTEACDLLCLRVAHCCISAHPLSAMVQDVCNGATVASLVAAFRDPGDAKDTQFALALLTIVCHACPSSLALSDRNNQYPIHHAARKGHSSCLTYLAEHFKYTVALQDLTGKFPLHHAVLSAPHHQLDAVLYLARLYPKALAPQDDATKPLQASAFNILAFAAKHCAADLVQELKSVIEQFSQNQNAYHVQLVPAQPTCANSASPSSSHSSATKARVAKRQQDAAADPAGGFRLSKASRSRDDSLLMLLSAATAQQTYAAEAECPPQLAPAVQAMAVA